MVVIQPRPGSKSNLNILASPAGDLQADEPDELFHIDRSFSTATSFIIHYPVCE